MAIMLINTSNSLERMSEYMHYVYVIEFEEEPHKL